MGKLGQQFKSARRILLVQVVIGGAVFGCFSLSRAAGVFAQTAPQPPQAPAQTPAPVPQQTPVAAASAASAAALPDGPGKDTLIRVCTKCHSATQVMAKRQDRQGWEDTIVKMSGMGANASDAEFTEILDYLVKNFPPSAN